VTQQCVCIFLYFSLHLFLADDTQQELLTATRACMRVHSLTHLSLIPCSQKATKVGRWFTHKLVNILEFVGLAPKGTVKTHDFLIKVC
jgi:hypothetical protein